MDLRKLVEAEIGAEVAKAQSCQEGLEHRIRAAFMRGMVLGARLQTTVSGSDVDESGWCAIRELV